MTAGPQAGWGHRTDGTGGASELSEAAMIRGLVLAEANRDRVRDGGEWGKLFMTGALRHGTGFMLSIVHSSVATWGSWCSQHSLLA